VSAVQALFIQLDVPHDLGLTAALKTPRESPLKQALDLLGAQAQQPRGTALDLRTEQDVNREALKEQGEAPARFGPREADGMDTTLGAVHARHLRLEQSLELAGIQMSPGASLRMIVNRCALLTTRALEEALAGAMR
jgi:hypothetical protein